MVTEESLNTASVTNHSGILAGFATNADFGYHASEIGSLQDVPHFGGPSPCFSADRITQIRRRLMAQQVPMLRARIKGAPVILEPKWPK